MNPPFHIYEGGAGLPQHARGGHNGQSAFIAQLQVAAHHLSPRGMGAFVMMCGGTHDAPAFCDYIPQIFRGRDLFYGDVLPPIDSATFLAGVHGGDGLDFQARFAQQYPALHYCVGLIMARELGAARVEHTAWNSALGARTSWRDRIALHRDIEAHDRPSVA